MADVENRGDWAGLGLWPRASDNSGAVSPMSTAYQLAVPDGAVRVHLIMDDEGGAIGDADYNSVVFLVPYSHTVLPVRGGDAVVVLSNVWSFWFDMVSEP